jgi:hypothetical protein
MCVQRATQQTRTSFKCEALEQLSAMCNPSPKVAVLRATHL